VLAHGSRQPAPWLTCNVRQKISVPHQQSKKRSIMAVHHVTFTVPERDLGKADVEFDVKKDGSKVGKLNISKGAVVWVPKDHTYGYKMGWVDFAALMKEHGTKEE
jgi:hypothetical protein